MRVDPNEYRLLERENHRLRSVLWHKNRCLFIAWSLFGFAALLNFL